MSFIIKFGTWLAKHILSLDCILNGHANVVIIERYSSTIKEKNFRGSSIKKLVEVKPYKEVITYGKLKCMKCGQIFIGNCIVNDIIPR